MTSIIIPSPRPRVTGGKAICFHPGPGQREGLADLAARSGQTTSDLIRLAIDTLLASAVVAGQQEEK